MKHLIFVLVFFLSQVLVIHCQAPEKIKTGMVPFTMDWEGFTESYLDLSFLHEKPAGKNGFIKIKNGHFFTASGTWLQ